MKRLILNLVLLAPTALLLWTADAAATTQTGQITGYVSDPTGLPVPDVHLELTGENMIGGARKTVTNEDGEFRFRELPPGEYVLISSHELYRKARTENLRVKVGRTITIDIVLEPPVAEEAEAYIVKGTIPVVDTESTALGATISDTFTETVPTSREYQGVAQLAPGVTGGGNPNVYGSTARGNQYLLDGINITDPVTNTFSANFNFDAIQDVEVITGGRDAEYGSAVGGVINVVTKSGGNNFTADTSLYYSSSFLQYRERGEEDLNNQMYQLNLNVGGPIIKDRLWFFVSGEVPWAVAQLSPSVTSGIFPDQEGKPYPARDFKAFYGLAKLTWQPFSNQTFRFMLHGDPATIDNSDQIPTNHPDAETLFIQGGVLTSLTSETHLTEDIFLKNQIAYKHNRIATIPQSGKTDVAGRTNLETGTSSVNGSSWTDDNRHRLQLHSSVSYSLADLLGEHQFKAGLDVSVVFNSYFNSLPGDAFYIDNGLDPTDPNSVSGKGLPYQKQVLVEAKDTFIWGDHEGIFVQDIWKPFRQLTIRPGLRFDSSRMRNYTEEAMIHLNTVSPRVGLSWDPFDDNKTALRIGYYQYVDTGYLALSDFIGKNRVTRTYEYNPVTEKYDGFAYEEGGEDGVVGKDYLKDPWDQQRARTHEFVTGFERELISNLSLASNFIYRFYGNQYEDDEINLQWNQEGDDVVGFNSGEPGWVFSLGAPDEAFIRYYGVEVVLDKKFSSNWEMLGSYTWSWTEGTVEDAITYALDNPRNAQYEFGFLPQDRRHVLKIYASYRLPYGFILGGRVRYMSGVPYNRLYKNQYYNDYTDYRAPRGYDKGEDGELKELRTPDLFTANARLTWQLKELTGQRLDLIVDIFNILNARTPVDYEQRNLPEGGATQFGDVLDKLDPISVQLGMRYRY